MSLGSLYIYYLTGEHCHGHYHEPMWSSLNNNHSSKVLLSFSGPFWIKSWLRLIYSMNKCIHGARSNVYGSKNVSHFPNFFTRPDSVFIIYQTWYRVSPTAWAVLLIQMCTGLFNRTWLRACLRKSYPIYMFT